MAHSAEAHSETHSTRIYWITTAVLAVLTAMEVGIFIAQIEFEVIALPFWAFVISLLVLSFSKGTLVVANFMHLRGDAGIFKFLFLTAFMLASGMMISFLLIYSQQHVGIAG